MQLNILSRKGKRREYVHLRCSQAPLQNALSSSTKYLPVFFNAGPSTHRPILKSILHSLFLTLGDEGSAQFFLVWIFQEPPNGSSSIFFPLTGVQPFQTWKSQRKIRVIKEKKIQLCRALSQGCWSSAFGVQGLLNETAWAWHTRGLGFCHST